MKIQGIAYHRNGCAGNGFNVITFKAEKTNMVAVIFNERGQVAVFDRELLGKGVIASSENSWRGDHFEPDLRAAIADKEKP
jgi:hypothetical protein